MRFATNLSASAESGLLGVPRMEYKRLACRNNLEFRCEAPLDSKMRDSSVLLRRPDGKNVPLLDECHGLARVRIGDAHNVARDEESVAYPHVQVGFGDEFADVEPRPILRSMRCKG